MKAQKKQLESFFIASNKYLQANGQESKLCYALMRTRKKLMREYETYLEEIQDMRIEKASSNEKGFISINDGQYDFTHDNFKELNKMVTLKSHEEIEFEPYFATEIPKDLPWEFVEAFTDFVIDNNFVFISQ